MFDQLKNEIQLQHRAFLAKMPFQGDLPDITKPENYNRFRREIKNYFFNTEGKQQAKKEFELQMKTESKGIFFLENIHANLLRL